MDPRYKSPTANVDIEVEEGFRDLEQITSALKWMLWVGALLCVFSLVSSGMQIHLLSGPYDAEQGRVNDLREQSLTILNLLYYVATAIVFGRWILLAHRNLPALGVRTIEVTPGWAVGWFFVPIVNLWMPYQAMRFLWRASHSATRPDIQDSGWALQTWWTLWIVNWIVDRIVMVQASRARTVAELTVMTQWNIVGHVAMLALYVVVSMLVMRIWEAQRRQKDNPGEFDPAPGFAG